MSPKVGKIHSIGSRSLGARIPTTGITRKNLAKSVAPSLSVVHQRKPSVIRRGVTSVSVKPAVPPPGFGTPGR